MFVYGETALEGSVLVSFQYLSSYNASRHAPPHEYIIAFSTQAGGLTGWWDSRDEGNVWGVQSCLSGCSWCEWKLRSSRSTWKCTRRGCIKLLTRGGWATRIQSGIPGLCNSNPSDANTLCSSIQLSFELEIHRKALIVILFTQSNMLSLKRPHFSTRFSRGATSLACRDQELAPILDQGQKYVQIVSKPQHLKNVNLFLPPGMPFHSIVLCSGTAPVVG